METVDAKVVHTLASELSEALITDERTNGEKFTKLRDKSPQWMTDVIHKAHGDKMPDDDVYTFCEDAADAISNADEDGSIDDFREAIDEIEPSCYTADQMRWFARNWEYCDQAIEEGLWQSGGKTAYGSQSTSVTDLVAIGMQLHIREIGNTLLDALIEEAESRES